MQSPKMDTNAEKNEILFSVILAFRNEERYLELYLKSLDDQTLPRNRWEVIMVDGCSSDGSRSIAESYAAKHSNARLLENPKKIVTAGWNRGLESSKGRFYHIANGHSINDPNFMSEAMEILAREPEIHALGGRIFKVGLTKVSKAISAAMNTAFAMGGSYYRIGTKERKVNVIGQGIYWRGLIDSIGPYDESLGRSGDWEFNYRINKYGFNMKFNPRIIIKVFSRAGYIDSFYQMFKTGFWKVKIWGKHPRSLLVRHVAPSLFVIYLLALSWATVFQSPGIVLLWAIPLFLYIIGAAIGGKIASKEKVSTLMAALTFPVVHIAYGTGFIVGLIRWWESLVLREKVPGR